MIDKIFWTTIVIQGLALFLALLLKPNKDTPDGNLETIAATFGLTSMTMILTVPAYIIYNIWR